MHQAAAGKWYLIVKADISKIEACASSFLSWKPICEVSKTKIKINR